MKLHAIYENEYEDLEDIDEFDDTSCVYCGIDANQDEVIDFNGERACVACIEERPVHDWIKNDPNWTEEKILKYLQEELGQLGEDFGVEGISFKRESIIATFTSEAETTYYSPPDKAAKHLAEKIAKVRKIARERFSW